MQKDLNNSMSPTHYKWDDWKNISDTEKKYIDASFEARRQILKVIPKENIVSIYVTGSLPRRDLNEKSDIDTNTIVKSEEDKQKLQELSSSFGKSHEPEISFSGTTLDQLKTNTSPPGHALPDRFLKRLDIAQIIYGEELDPNDYPVRSDEEELAGEIKSTREWAIPTILKREMGFQQFCKKAFWLAEAEFRLRERRSSSGWQEMEKYYPEDHIFHKAMAYRNKNTQDDDERRQYTEEVEKYMQMLEKVYLDKS